MFDPQTEEARRAILATLEPQVQEALDRADITVHQLDRAVAFSQAVSLRRIADALQPQIVQGAAVETVHLSEESLHHIRGIASELCR